MSYEERCAILARLKLDPPASTYAGYSGHWNWEGAAAAHEKVVHLYDPELEVYIDRMVVPKDATWGEQIFTVRRNTAVAPFWTTGALSMAGVARYVRAEFEALLPTEECDWWIYTKGPRPWDPDDPCYDQ